MQCHGNGLKKNMIRYLKLNEGAKVEKKKQKGVE
jgi:hypothetical protein